MTTSFPAITYDNGSLSTSLLLAVEAERNVLGACLLEPNAIAVVVAHLRPEHFSTQQHSLLWRVILNLWERQMPPSDPAIFRDALLRAPFSPELELPEIYVAGLRASVPTAFYVEHYARLVREHSAIRRHELAASRNQWTEAQRALEELNALQEHGLTGPTRFRLYTPAELDALPPEEFLISGLLLTDAVTELFGDSGTYKTFTALDWGLCVACGYAWNGRRVKQGPVVYVISEGTRGFQKRIDAWCAHHEREAPEQFYVLPDTVRLLDTGDVNAFLQLLAGFPVSPVMVTFDTWNRALDGGDENAPGDTGRAFSAVDAVRKATGAAPLVIHHGTKDGKWDRGHSSLRNNVQTQIAAFRDGQTGSVILYSKKQKDHEDFRPIRLDPHPLTLNDGRNSLVLIEAGYVQPQPVESADRVEALAILDAAEPEGLGHNEWVRRFVAHTGKSEKTGKRIIKELRDEGLVDNPVGGTYHRSQPGLQEVPEPGSTWGQTPAGDPWDDYQPADPTAEREIVDSIGVNRGHDPNLTPVDPRSVGVGSLGSSLFRDDPMTPPHDPDPRGDPDGRVRGRDP